MMRIVKVDPDEKRVLAVFPKPIEGQVHDFVSRPLGAIQIFFKAGTHLEMVVIKIEPMVEAEARIQHRRADNSAGSISVIMQNRSQRRLLRIQLVAAEIVHAAVHRIGSGENAGMRGQSYGNSGKGMLEKDAAGRQRVNVWSLDIPVTVTAKMIRTQRINGD